MNEHLLDMVRTAWKEAMAPEDLLPLLEQELWFHSFCQIYGHHLFEMIEHGEAEKTTKKRKGKNAT